MLRIVRTFRVSGVLQICKYVFLVAALPAFGFERKFNSNQDTVLINFPRRTNSSRAVTRYLPPEVSDALLPEVIDNRARDTAAYNNIPRYASNVSLGERESRFYQRPVNPRAKYASLGQANLVKDAEISSGTVKITEMSCQNAGEDVYFRASVKPPKPLESPVIENTVNDACKTKKINDEYKIDFAGEQFWNCGVQDCSTEIAKFYCLALRFPAISGIRLKEDFKVTLQCKVQEKTASHTKLINVKTLDTAARMMPNVVTGGLKNSLETEVGLYRKTYSSENVFDARIQSGGTVVLGEEILLRVLVREGDGWRYSRISDVTVHYVEKRQRKKIMNSLWILDGNGCLNPEVREICSREQYKVSPLESYLIFQAFMFDNMKESDEMVLSVKVTGCLEGADCILNCPAGHSRRTRSLEESRNSTIDWRDDIAFKVVYPKYNVLKKSTSEYLAIPYVFLTFTLLVIIILLWTIKILLRRRAPKS